MLRRLALLATLFACCVIVFGAFVRLSNAGLSCPDWPTCYGKATWPGHAQEIESANAAFPDRPFETHKAWREQVHRMLAGTLGVLVLGIALVAVRGRSRATVLLIGAAVSAALGVFSYLHGAFALSMAFAIIAMLIPVIVATGLDRRMPWRIAVITLTVVIFQAMLGMWTVTLQLKPIVVMGHLLGGLLLFALLGAIALQLIVREQPSPSLLRLRPMIVVGVVLVACQIALGGWTSANYAATACGIDFPQCLGHWWPATDFREGFVLWRGIGVNYEGGVLDLPARSAIQIAHRIGALIVFGYVLALVFAAWRRRVHALAATIAALLIAQIALGISNVVFALPLVIATAHNGVAALLLLALVALLVHSCVPVADLVEEQLAIASRASPGPIAQ
ncbi:MAG: COX15/CtaA family protein [Dokdonella sp.]